MTERLRGLGVGTGRVVGPAVVVSSSMPEPPPGAAGAEPAAEAADAAVALQWVAGRLGEFAATATGEAKDILDAQVLFAADPGLAADVAERTGAGVPAARAVFEAFGRYRELLGSAGDYIAARVTDLDDVRDRTIARLLGLPPPGVPYLDEPGVLVARDLAPADTATLDPARVLGFVTAEGGPTSHTAIIARSLQIPAIVGCAGAMEIAAGTRLLVDAGAGVVVVDPSESEIASAGSHPNRPHHDTGRPGATADGHAVALLANVGGPADAAAAVAAHAEGVGLLRTEFLFLGRDEEPSVAEQVAAYADVLGPFAGSRVVVRTLDAGADKPLPFLSLADEANPALGRRGLRAMQDPPDVLDRQLAAIATAARSCSAVTWVMAPMVADVEDTRWFLERARGHALDVVGVMVEIPAAALQAGAILELADFASLGTNDLAQYALAADRLSGPLGRFQDPWQPAVLRLVQMTADAGARQHKPVGVCGEAAADPMLACVLVGLGIGSLSMSASAIPVVRGQLAAVGYDECVRLAELALGAVSAVDARAAVADALR